MGDTNTNGWKKVENPVKGGTSVADKPQQEATIQEPAQDTASEKNSAEKRASAPVKKEQSNATAGSTAVKKTARRKPRVMTTETSVPTADKPQPQAVPMQTEAATPSMAASASETEAAMPPTNTRLPASEALSDDLPSDNTSSSTDTLPSPKSPTSKKRTSVKKSPPSAGESTSRNLTEELAAIPSEETENPNALIPKEPSADGWKQVGIIPAAASESMEGEDTPVIRAPYDYTKKPRRKRRYRFAAPLGLLVLLLAATGVISLVVMGVQAIQRSQDDTALRTELMDFLEPVVQYMPSPFEDVNDNPQEALLLGAIWRVTEEERIRMLREKDEVSRYPTDDLGRMEIPVSKILDSYATLFGKDAQPSLVTIGDPGLSFTFEYDAANGIYHVPYTSASTSYVPVLDTLKRKGSSYTLRIGYVPNNDIGVDEKGNPVDPLPEQADYFLLYHVEKEGDGWRLVSVSADK